MFKALVFCLFLLSIHRAAAQTNWTRCSEGLPDTTILSLAKIGSILFAGSHSAGIYRSNDGGGTWLPTPFHPKINFTQSWSMAVIDTFLFTGQRGPGMFRLGPNEPAWTEVNSGLGHKIIQDLIVVDSGLYAATFGGGVFFSNDLGQSWSAWVGNSGLNDLKILALAANQTTLFAGTNGTNTSADTGVAFRMPLNGLAWEQVNMGFHLNGVHLEQVFALETSDSLVFSGTDDVGFYRSDSEGTFWESVGSYNGDIHAIKAVGSTVFYGTSFGGVFRSDDAGASFQPDVTGFAFGNMTLPNLVKDFLVDGSTIFAASDIGVFKKSLPLTIVTTSPPAASGARLDVAPNPFEQETAVRVFLPETGTAVIGLVNSCGQQVYRQIITALTDDEYQLVLAGGSLPAGIYTLYLQWKQGFLYQKIVRF